MLTPYSSQTGSFLPLYWLSVGAGKFHYSGVFFSCDSGTTCFQHVFPLSLFLNPGITQSVFMDERSESFVLSINKRERGRVRNRGVWQLEEVCVWGQQRAPPSSLAIAALLFASCPLPDSGHSSGSRSGAAAGARAPAPSTGPRPARHHCPGLSPSAWGRKRWGRGLASYGLVGAWWRKRGRRGQTNRMMLKIGSDWQSVTETVRQNKSY